MFVQQFRSLLDRWKPVFPQERTHKRAIEHAMAFPATVGRRTISRTICALGRAHQDWSGEYKMFSRSAWKSAALFDPVIDEYILRYPKGPIPLAGDDTKLTKTGKKIPGVFFQRDPLSPPFHVNLLWGLRFIQFSLLFPHHREGDFPPRAIPVRFDESAAVKKPRKATEQQMEEYKAARKQKNLSTDSLAVMRQLRARFDEKAASDRNLLFALDGAFCNQTIFRSDLQGVDLLTRCRKDARLCFPAVPGSRRTYAVEVFTPEQVRQDKERSWHETKVYFGSKRRVIKYKEVRRLLWRTGAATKPLRLIVIAPIPYKVSKNSRTHYRQPAYLLSTDLKSSTKLLIQTYFDRWQIEVNHRDEKSLLGVGQAQVHSLLSVPRQPAFAVAVYSLLLLAALKAHGPGRAGNYPDLPKWRRNAKRPSLLDLLSLLRKQINEPVVSRTINQQIAGNLLPYAYT